MKGSLTRRGQAYRIRIYLGRHPVTKSRQYYTETIQGTKRDAERRLRDKITEIEAGQRTQLVDERLDLIDFLDRWLASPSRTSTLKARTAADKRALVNRYLRPHPVAKVRLSQLTPLHLQNVYDELLGRGLAGGTIRNLHAVLSKSLRQAVRWRLLPTSPAPDVELPSGKSRREALRPFTPEEAVRFLQALVGHPFEALFNLALASGMRPGEVLGLQWNEVDFANSAVRVERALVRVPGESGWRLEPPKTAESRRTNLLPPEAMEKLKAHGETAAPGHLFSRRELGGFVFQGRTGAPLHERNLVKRQFKPLLELAGISSHHALYDLRHTCATLCLLLGLPAKVVSERLGHASIRITMDIYSSVLPTMQRSAADQLAGLLYPST